MAWRCKREARSLLRSPVRSAPSTISTSHLSTAIELNRIIASQVWSSISPDSFRRVNPKSILQSGAQLTLPDFAYVPATGLIPTGREAPLHPTLLINHLSTAINLNRIIAGEGGPSPAPVLSRRINPKNQLSFKPAGNPETCLRQPDNQGTPAAASGFPNAG